MRPKSAELFIPGCGSACLGLLILWSKLSVQGARYWSSGPEAFGILSEFFALSLGGAGVLLIFKAAIAPLAGRLSSETLRIFPEMALRNAMPLRRRPESRPIANLPNFGLVCGAVILVPFINFAMFELSFTQKGFYLQLQHKEVIAQRTSPWGTTMSVYVDGQGRFSVNGEIVKREELASKLSQQLATKPMVWSVYFEADPSTQFGDAVFAFDTIRGSGARVIWITPRMREEWKREGVETAGEVASRDRKSAARR